eukprot:SAG11_NODE_37120_length_258_cov_0.949686_1_plen_33_part_10
MIRGCSAKFLKQTLARRGIENSIFSFTQVVALR